MTGFVEPHCACTGIRSCRLCISSQRVKALITVKPYADYTVYVRIKNGNIRRVSDLTPDSSLDDICKAVHCDLSGHREDTTTNSLFSGITLVENFLTEAEESLLIEAIDRGTWSGSQSGRRKQDYGPRVNFKAKKVRLDAFGGLPDYTDAITTKMKQQLQLLDCFQPVELCNLEYEQSRSSAIDLHQDDSWIWGEHLVSVNMNSECVMTFADYEEKRLAFVLLPRRSLLVVSGEARYRSLHGIFPQHVKGRRVVLTMRELAPSFLVGGEDFKQYGEEIMRLSSLRVPQSEIPSK